MADVTAPSPHRIESLDVFRGLTIAAMTIVNNPGSWSHMYAPLKHAEWHGLTPTDLIFPFFVFIVGVCIPLSLRKYVTPSDGAPRVSSAVCWRIVRRSLLIFFISLIVLHGFPWTLEKLRAIRIPGVLQRIAICYLVTSLLFLKLRTRGLIAVTGGLLVGYWLLLKCVAAPGFEAYDLTKVGSLPSWVDRTLLAGHIYKPEYDPEGLLSTLPAVATCLSGLLAGLWLLSARSRNTIALGLLVVGMLSCVAGWLWSLEFPINKALWTSSYVLVSSGFALIALSICYWVIDVCCWKRWSVPFRILGMNAFLIFVASGFVGRLLGWFRIAAADGTSVSVQLWLRQRLCDPWLSPINASLAWSLLVLAFWFAVACVLDRKRVYVRV